MARPRAKCGTEAAYRRHLREKEPVDDACRKAHADTARERKRRRITEKLPETEYRVKARESPPVKPKASPPKPPKPEPQPQEYTKDEHIRIIRSTLDQLTQALSDVLIATPDKVGPISREIRAMTAELERLTTEEETEVKEESALDHFFTNNVVGFPGTQAG